MATDTWAVGDTVAFSGSATDSQQTLPPTAFDWQIVINHCPSDCHQHVMQNFLDTKSGSFAAPDHDYPSSLTLNLTVTDAGGLADTESVTIEPRTVNLTLDAAPSGLEVALNDNPTATPFTRTVIEGSQNTVIAPDQEFGGDTYLFTSWSDGGLATHNITADQTKTLVATFRDISLPAVPGIIDTTGPETVITSGPPSKVNLRSRKPASRPGNGKKKAWAFRFSALEPAVGFECRFDARAWTPCSSPLSLPKMRKGAHIFEVRAKDVLGNVDQTPALRRFRIVKPAVARR